MGGLLVEKSANDTGADQSLLAWQSRHLNQRLNCVETAHFAKQTFYIDLNQ
jgi:hypothetical protein